MAESTRTHACILMRLHVSDPTPPPKASTPDTPDFSPEAIAEALNEATPGPWQAREGWNLMPPMRYEIAAPDVEEWSVVEAGDNDWGPAGGVNKKADAHLIANAPTWLAQLLAALEASERENERMREALEEIAVADGRNAPWDGATSLNVARTLASMARAALTPSTPPDPREDA